MAQKGKIIRTMERKNVVIPEHIDIQVRKMADTMGITYSACLAVLLNTALKNVQFN